MASGQDPATNLEDALEVVKGEGDEAGEAAKSVQEPRAGPYNEAVVVNLSELSM